MVYCGLERLVRGSFFGRQSDLESLMGLLEEKRGVAVVVGESGIGKSTLLEALREELKGSEEFVVGWYEVYGSVSTIYPFLAVLGSLLAWIDENEPVKAKIEVNLRRFGKALKNIREAIELYLEAFPDELKILKDLDRVTSQKEVVEITV